MKILLVVDTSPENQTALAEVAGRCWPAGSSFDVISVVEPSHLWTTSEIALETARRAEQVVDSAVAKLKLKSNLVTGSTFSGDPKTVILDRAVSTGADFLIVDSHGSAVSRFLQGTVTATVLRYAPCSVEVMRARTEDRDPEVTKVLLATDGSECSEQAARSIAERPWQAGTEIRVLNAVELILPATRALFQPPFIDSDVIESAQAQAMKRSQDAITRAREILSSSVTTSQLNVSEAVSVLLEAPQTIVLNEAAEWGADLIVLGSHGHHGVDRFLLGSVSESVAMHAGCSVEVIRKTEYAKERL
jgi:nucleotide-binding universal stress UspA family protein